MAVNSYFQSGIPMGRSSEQLLMEDLIIECLKIYGFETYYLPRTEVNRDILFLEDPLSKFVHSYPIEAYMKNVDGFQGDGDLMTKFGVEIRDTSTLIISRRRWDELIGRTGNAILPARPAEGDVIYFPLTNSFFEIKKVNTMNPFYQLGKLYVYEMECELMRYSSEKFDTGIEEIDDIANAKSLENNFVLITSEDDVLVMDLDTPTAIIIDETNIEVVDNQSQNYTFEEDVFDVLDFSEKNPFGEVI